MRQHAVIARMEAWREHTHATFSRSSWTWSVTVSRRERIDVKRASVVSSEPVAGSGSGFAGVGLTVVPGGASRVRSAWRERGGPRAPEVRPGGPRAPRGMGGGRRRFARARSRRRTHPARAHAPQSRRRLSRGAWTAPAAAPASLATAHAGAPPHRVGPRRGCEWICALEQGQGRATAQQRARAAAAAAGQTPWGAADGHRGPRPPSGRPRD